MKGERGKIVFPVLYVNGIILIGSDMGMLSMVKVWLAQMFDMKNLGGANYIIEIKLFLDKKKKKDVWLILSYLHK